MPRWQARDTTLMTDMQYQDYILDGVSRTFALTIPQLPAALRPVVGNAYLLCRIADTIEDDADLTATAKTRLSQDFVAVVAGKCPATTFAHDLVGALSSRTPGTERDLITNIPRVIRLTHATSPGTRRAMQRCIKIMATGMAHYQRKQTPGGLADMGEVDRYCYHVAGVVGEMLTEFYAEYCPTIAAHRATMMPLAVSFGEGLQLTNILKDIWEDHSRAACWLPRTVFAAHGIDLTQLGQEPYRSGFGAALAEMIGIAHGHLQNALRSTLMLPASERGLRRFCLWALGMAILTLHKINRHRDFRSGMAVKISRLSVRAVILATDLMSSHDGLLNSLFTLATRGLPRTATPVTICAEPLTEPRDAIAYPLPPQRSVAASTSS